MDYLEKEEFSFDKIPRVALNYNEEDTLYYAEFTLK